MESEIPWTSCLLTRMLVLYLERIGKGTEVDYSAVLSGMDHLKRIDNPKDFLKDYNNWVPYHVLKNLIHAAETATGSKEAAFLAAKTYFQQNQAPSLVEIIAKLLNNIEQILISSNLWAEAYTNYLRLQCFKPSNSEGSEVVILSQFGLKVEPLIGNINLVRGNYEGFTRLFDHVEEAACVEQLSQLKIETVIKEFENYQIKKTDDRLSIIETTSSSEVASARRVYLKSETIPFSAHNPAIGDGFIVPPKDGKVEALAPVLNEDSEKWLRENEAYEIVQGGTLQTDGITYTFREGQFFNAPYSRYQFKWKSKGVPRELPEITQAKSEIVPLLFEHLRRIRDTQRRLLVCAIENETLARANVDLEAVLQKDSNFFGIIWKSKKMQKLLEQAQLIAEADSTVLIMGETGTGKELLAKAIHQSSPRKDQKFFAISCAALTESLLEAELFGYEKGAFTGAVSQKKGIFEAAHRGTLFLDEVGEISPAMQAKLLRVLEEHEIQRVGGREAIPVDVRLISATNRNLEELVASGKFRQDLFYRLHVISLLVPPLQERLEDLSLLIDHYLNFFSQKYKKTKSALTRAAFDLLTNYRWPGNVRQLKNVIERAVVLDQDQQITLEDIILPDEDQGSPKIAAGEPQAFHDAIEKYKRSVIEEVLKKTGGNQTKAAELLGLQRTYLVRLIRQLNISTKD